MLTWLLSHFVVIYGERRMQNNKLLLQNERIWRRNSNFLEQQQERWDTVHLWKLLIDYLTWGKVSYLLKIIATSFRGKNSLWRQITVSELFHKPYFSNTYRSLKKNDFWAEISPIYSQPKASFWREKFFAEIQFEFIKALKNWWLSDSQITMPIGSCIQSRSLLSVAGRKLVVALE